MTIERGRINPEEYGEVVAESYVTKGGGGGKKKKDGPQGRKTRATQAGEMKLNQLKNVVIEGESGKKTPEKDITDVLLFIKNLDEGDPGMKNLERYIAWVKKNINSIDDLVVEQNEISKLETMTAHLGAGGGGKDTSNNARAATHLLTGIRERSQDERKATGNIISVKEKIREELQQHLRNWRLIMEVVRIKDEQMRSKQGRDNSQPVDLNMLLGEEILDRAASL